MCVVCKDGFTARGFRLSRLGPRYDAPAVRWGYSAAPVVFDGLRPVVRDHVIYDSLSHTTERRDLATRWRRLSSGDSNIGDAGAKEITGAIGASG